MILICMKLNSICTDTSLIYFYSNFGNPLKDKMKYYLQYVQDVGDVNSSNIHHFTKYKGVDIGINTSLSEIRYKVGIISRIRY